MVKYLGLFVCHGSYRLCSPVIGKEQPTHYKQLKHTQKTGKTRNTQNTGKQAHTHLRDRELPAWLASLLSFS